jgi:hypothetical protein
MRTLTDLYSRRDEEKRGSSRLFPHQLDVPFILWRRVHISFAITSEIPLVCHVSLSNRQNSKRARENHAMFKATKPTVTKLLPPLLGFAATKCGNRCSFYTSSHNYGIVKFDDADA